MKKFLDTSSILVWNEDLTDCIISSVTLEELEGIKSSANKDDTIKAQARQAVRAIERDNVTVYIYGQDALKIIQDMKLSVTNDNVIICNAYQQNLVTNDVIFYSEDYLCRLIAEHIFGLNVASFGEQKEDIYQGYQMISGDVNYINDWFVDPDLSKWHTNEYLLINNTDDGRTTEMRFDGSKFMNLRLPSSNFIKGQNSLQRCALDALYNKEISAVALLGTYGSGKSFLTMQMAKYLVVDKSYQQKMIGIREAMGEGKEIGFLPGTMDDKISDFFLPLKQQMKKDEFEFLKSQGKIETKVPFYLKGCSFSDSILVVDEAEDLTKPQIKLIGTRLGDNSRLFISGDYKQSLINKTSHNALVQMCNELKGNPNFACIVLDEDVRSEASKMFANIF